MKRINVIGTTGSGKSTMARSLVEILDCPYVQIDQLFWKADWKETPDVELFPVLTEAISGDFWVLDGNYSRTNKIKWERVDTIIWMDFGYMRTLFQLTKRTITRAITQQELWPGTGNKESFSKSFASGDSILIWFFRQYGRNRVRYSRLMQSNDHSHIKLIRLKNPGEARAFLQVARNSRVQTGAAESHA